MKQSLEKTAPGGLAAPAVALGIALGGFFDGILLHQILQWHHLLSGLDSGRLSDVRMQILADGLFHAVLYVIAAGGLVLLLRRRSSLAAPGTGRQILASALIGFGLWHCLDAVLSHWILGIHRIRMDSETPLVWDLVWFAVFGVGAMAAGLWLGRRPGPPGGSARAGAPTLAALVLVAGTLALMPPFVGADTATLVVFRPGTTPAQAMSAVLAADGRLVWADSTDSVFAIELPPGASRMALYRGGALLVSDTIGLAGCLDWFERPGISARAPTLPLPPETA